MNYLKSIILIVFIFIADSTFSQELWTLQQCVEYAYQNNIQIKQQKLNTELTKNTYTQSKLSILPNLNAGADYSMYYGRSVDPYTNQFSDNNGKSSNLSLSSSVTLFNGLQTLNTIKKNKLNFLAALQDFEKMKNDIGLNLSGAYLQILFNRELVKIAENQLELSKNQEKRVKIIVKAGKLTAGDLLEIQAQIANEELQLINSENQLDNSLLLLKQILDLKDSITFNISEPIIDEIENTVIPYTVEEIYEKAQELPQIKGAEFRVSAAERELSVSKGGRSPRLTSSATYGTGYSDRKQNLIPGDTIPMPIGYVGGTNSLVFRDSPTFSQSDYLFLDQFKENGSTTLGFRLTIPIFNNWQTQTNIKNSKINTLNNKLALLSAKNNLYKNIQSAYLDTESAIARYKSSKKAVLANEESFKYSEKKYELGSMNTIDFNTAKNNLVRAISDYIQAKYDFLFKKSILDFYAGNEISIGN